MWDRQSACVSLRGCVGAGVKCLAMLTGHMGGLHIVFILEPPDHPSTLLLTLLLLFSFKTDLESVDLSVSPQRVKQQY